MNNTADKLAAALRRGMSESGDVPAGFDVDAATWWAEAHRALAEYDAERGPVIDNKTATECAPPGPSIGQAYARDIVAALADHPDAERGNSKVHFALCRARALLAQPDADNDTGREGSVALVHAYAHGAANGGSIDWSNLNQAHDLACVDLGPERVAAIVAMYAEGDDDEG